MTGKISRKSPRVHIWVNSQNRQLTGFDLDSNFQLKCLNSRRVKNLAIIIITNESFIECSCTGYHGALQQ